MENPLRSVTANGHEWTRMDTNLKAKREYAQRREGKRLISYQLYLFAASESLRGRPGAPLQALGALTLAFYSCSFASIRG